MVPPARPYPLIAPFRELRALALLAAVSSAATRTVEMAQVTTLVPLGTAALGRRDTLEG
jgi:hypothetical protein